MVRAGKPFRVEGCDRARLPKGHSVVILGESCSARRCLAFPNQLSPDLSRAMDAEVLVEDAPDFFARSRCAVDMSMTAGLGCGAGATPAEIQTDRQRTRRVLN